MYWCHPAVVGNFWWVLLNIVNVVLSSGPMNVSAPSWDITAGKRFPSFCSCDLQSCFHTRYHFPASSFGSKPEKYQYLFAEWQWNCFTYRPEYIGIRNRDCLQIRRCLDTNIDSDALLKKHLPFDLSLVEVIATNSSISFLNSFVRDVVEETEYPGESKTSETVRNFCCIFDL